MAMRWLMLLIIGLTAILRAGAPSAGDPAAPGDAVLRPMVSEAMYHSEELAALQAQAEAAAAMIRPAGALPDPMAMVGLSNIPVGSGVALDEDMMSGVMLSLSQEVTPRSRRRLMRDAQSAEAAMMAAQVADKRNDIARRVRRAYIDVQYRDAALSVAERNLEVAKEMLATAEALYATGKAMQQEVFESQVRVSQMVDMVVMQRREREVAATRLNRLLYRPPDQPLPDLPPLAMSPLTSKPEALPARALETNPALRAMETRVEQARKQEGVAASMIEPHLTFSFSYMIRQQLAMNPDSGTDMWSATVGMNLPWFRREETVDREVEVAQAQRRAAESEVAAMRNELPAMADEMLIDIARTEEQLALLETGLMPQAEGAYAASRASYASGKGELLHLLDNQMNLYNLELQRAMLLAERGRALAELAYVVGME